MSRAEPMSTWLRLMGIAALLHVAVGLGFAGLSMATFPQLGSAGFSDDAIASACAISDPASGETVDDCKRTMSASRMNEVVSSVAFKCCYAVFIGFGLVFNVVLALAGWKLLGRDVATGVRRLTLLMFIFIVWFYGVPLLLLAPVGDAGRTAFAGAWGIGNMGVAWLLVTRFWLRGPAIAIFATRSNWVWRTSRMV